MLELMTAVIAKCTNYNSAIFFAAQDNDIKTLHGLLSRFGENPNRYDGENHTPLSTSLLANSYNATVLLLEFGADPNMVVKMRGESCGKHIEICLKFRDISAIKLLALYGAKSEGITVPSGCENEQRILVEHTKKKQQLDELTNLAKRQLRGNTPNYSCSLINFQNAGNFWYELAQHETNKTYQKHYYEKAFQQFQHAENCLQHLSETMIKLNKKNYSQLFEHLADTAVQLNNNSLGRIYSQQAARLLSLSTQTLNNFSPSFPRGMRKTTAPESEPLLQDTTGQNNIVRQPNTTPHLKVS